MNYRQPPWQPDFETTMERSESKFYYKTEGRKVAVASTAGSLWTGDLLPEEKILPTLPDTFTLTDFMIRYEPYLKPALLKQLKGWRHHDIKSDAYKRFQNEVGRRMYYLQYLGAIEQINKRGEEWAYEKVEGFDWDQFQAPSFADDPVKDYAMRRIGAINQQMHELELEKQAMLRILEVGVE